MPTEPAGLAFVEGVSASMRPVEAVIRELAQSDVPVLVLAEPGAGKHATAQRIHQMSQRSARNPFVWLQCLDLKPETGGLAGAGKRRGAAECGNDLSGRTGRFECGLSGAFAGGSGRSLRGSAWLAASVRGSSVAALATWKSKSSGDGCARILYYRISGVCLRLPPLRQRKRRYSVPDGILSAQVCAGFSP